MIRPAVERNAVFLNFPFDARYEPLYMALVSGLVLHGLEPRCVLQLSGEERLTRLIEVLSTCGSSIHDVSRTNGRHNMPFELGLAAMLRHSHKTHQIFVFDAKPHRPDRTLSDFKAFDPMIHNGKWEDLLGALQGTFAKPKSAAPLASLKVFFKSVRRSFRSFMRQQGARSPYSPLMFQKLVDLSAETARALELLDP